MIYTNLSDKLEQFATEHIFIKAMYIFGSVAQETAKPNSDTDIAIVSNRQVSGWERIELENKLSDQIGADVDLTVFHQASPLLQHQILKYGSLVYEESAEERIRQEVEARYQYLDTRFLYKKLGDLINDGQ